jgi:hypothetical protein
MATTIELTPDTPTVVSWKEELKDRPDDYLIRISYGKPSAVDASHRYACDLLLKERGHEFGKLTPELCSVICELREETLLELAKLVLWLEWMPVPVNHKITDGPAFIRDELIYEVIRYSELLNRCMEECGGY